MKDLEERLLVIEATLRILSDSVLQPFQKSALNDEVYEIRGYQASRRRAIREAEEEHEREMANAAYGESYGSGE
jgi:hypothetical protein